MARGGRGGGGRNPANQSREVQVSRKISWLLRHGANQEGLKLGKGGYVNVQDAVSLPASIFLHLLLARVYADNMLDLDLQHETFVPRSSSTCSLVMY
jgi:2'-phosphotransferase